jgi:hypothetical protein
MTMIDDLKNLPRMWSVQLASLAVVLEVADGLLPFVGTFLPWYIKALVIVAAIVARSVKQPSLHDEQA